MARSFPEFTGQFFWNFERRDNVNYNFTILCSLYEARQTSVVPSHFNKPITIILVSMIECILYDLVDRIYGFRSDPFPNISDVEVAYIRSLDQTDELGKLIPRLKKPNLLRIQPNDPYYDSLELLRKTRNRIHIQNLHHEIPKDERSAFTDVELNMAQQCFEHTCEVLCNVYPRWGNTPIPMTDFPRPWT